MKFPKMLGYVATGTALFLVSLLSFASLGKTSLGSLPLAIFVVVFPVSNDLVIQFIPLAVIVASALLSFTIAGWIFWRESPYVGISSHSHRCLPGLTPWFYLVAYGGTFSNPEFK